MWRQQQNSAAAGSSSSSAAGGDRGGGILGWLETLAMRVNPPPAAAAAAAATSSRAIHLQVDSVFHLSADASGSGDGGALSSLLVY